MRATGKTEIYILKEGEFTLVPGAIFGTLPKSIWGRNYSENSSGRIPMETNVLIISRDSGITIIDTGVGTIGDERFRGFFEIKALADLRLRLKEFFGDKKIENIVHTHLHFDHVGNDAGLPLGKDSRILVQASEMSGYRHPNLITRSSYVKGSIPSRKVYSIRGTRRLHGGLTLISTGGHTEGHQVVQFEAGGRKFMHFGDLIPTSFHVKPNYIAAIDNFPMETMEMKMKLLRKVIREGHICIFNHNTGIPSGTVTGSVEKPVFNPLDIPTL